MVNGFDYNSQPAEKFEVPLAERIAQIRARKADERKRAKEKLERRTGQAAVPAKVADPAKSRHRRGGSGRPGQPGGPRGSGGRGGSGGRAR
jgi:ATP-dependent RNA helicase RhlE